LFSPHSIFARKLDQFSSHILPTFLLEMSTDYEKYIVVSHGMCKLPLNRGKQLLYLFLFALVVLRIYKC